MLSVSLGKVIKGILTSHVTEDQTGGVQVAEGTSSNILRASLGRKEQIASVLQRNGSLQKLPSGTETAWGPGSKGT